MARIPLKGTAAETFVGAAPSAEAGCGRQTHLHGAGGLAGALADVEKAGGAGGALATFAGRSPTVDDHGLLLEETHEVRWLLALCDTHLRGWNISFLWAGPLHLFIIIHASHVKDIHYLISLLDGVNL